MYDQIIHTHVHTCIHIIYTYYIYIIANRIDKVHLGLQKVQDSSHTKYIKITNKRISILCS